MPTAGPLRRFLVNYALRHQDSWNRAFHVVGLPLTFIVPVYFLSVANYYAAGICFVAGYALQFLGHACEGNDAGEMVLIKKALGLPYLAIVERNPPQPAPGSLAERSKESKFDE